MVDNYSFEPDEALNNMNNNNSAEDRPQVDFPLGNYSFIYESDKKVVFKELKIDSFN